MSRPQALRRKRERRKKRAGAKVKGTAERPRLSVFRSGRHLSLQLIDDATGTTLVSASDLELAAAKGRERSGRKAGAAALGHSLADKAKSKGIISVRFDRGRYRYQGLVRALAEGARQGGLKF